MPKSSQFYGCIPAQDTRKEHKRHPQICHIYMATNHQRVHGRVYCAIAVSLVGISVEAPSGPQTIQLASYPRVKNKYSYLGEGCGAKTARHPQTFPDVTRGNFPSPFQRLSKSYDCLDSIYPRKNSTLDTNYPTFQATFIP